MNEILREITARIEEMTAAAEREGAVLHPPLLMLGTSERVGSNWLSDTLRPVTGQHNEPFRQQLGPDHPLSALNPYVTGLDAAAQRLGPYGRHWLTCFVASKYVVTRQVVKETNLFFTLPNLLALFPDSPVTVLTRSPLGVVSSFARSDLYRRWSYENRYRQIVATTRRIQHTHYAPLVPDDRPDALTALVRLQVLNTILLATELHDRKPVLFSYESAVFHRSATLRALVKGLPDLHGALLPAASAERLAAAQDDTFATNGTKTDLIAYLDRADTELVRSTTALTLKAARDLVPPAVTDTAAHWLAGDHLYVLDDLRPRPHRDRAATRATAPVETAYVRRGAIEWRNLLVSNVEYAAFLNDLSDAGLSNCHDDSFLLICPMPHERGGRLHQDPIDGRWAISAGYEHHPVYWVTWIGAALFAAAHGARLPTRAELVDAAGTEPQASNTDYAVGDTTSIHQEGLGQNDVHHLVGNLQVWCGDGPGRRDLFNGPTARWLHGAAWNTPATSEEINRPRHRHLTGSSRGVGIRMVRDHPMPEITAGELTDLISSWFEVLAAGGQPLTCLGESLAHALNEARRSQPDVGLGSHVGAGAGEAALDQVGEPLGEPERRQIGDLHELHPADRPGVRADLDVTERAAVSVGLEGDVNDVGAAARQVVAHVQEPADLDVKAGLLPHLADQSLFQGLSELDLSTRQRPRPAGVGVLVEQQDQVVIKDDAGNPNVQHPGNLPQEGAL